VDKAISWPLSQERLRSQSASADSSALAGVLSFYRAPIQRKAIEQAPVLPACSWLKNEQLPESQTDPAAAAVMNGLSTGCSTVIVRKRRGWA
jgi:hypothetical protein